MFTSFRCSAGPPAEAGMRVAKWSRTGFSSPSTSSTLMISFSPALDSWMSCASAGNVMLCERERNQEVSTRRAQSEGRNGTIDVPANLVLGRRVELDVLEKERVSSMLNGGAVGIVRQLDAVLLVLHVDGRVLVGKLERAQVLGGGDAEDVDGRLLLPAAAERIVVRERRPLRRTVLAQRRVGPRRRGRRRRLGRLGGRRREGKLARGNSRRGGKRKSSCKKTHRCSREEGREGGRSEVELQGPREARGRKETKIRPSLASP